MQKRQCHKTHAPITKISLGSVARSFALLPPFRTLQPSILRRPCVCLGNLKPPEDDLTTDQSSLRQTLNLYLLLSVATLPENVQTHTDQLPQPLLQLCSYPLSIKRQSFGSDIALTSPLRIKHRLLRASDVTPLKVTTIVNCQSTSKTKQATTDIGYPCPISTYT